jgi:hypothetical protein
MASLIALPIAYCPAYWPAYCPRIASWEIFIAYWAGRIVDIRRLST